MKTARSKPREGEVRVKILPKDPLVARQKGLWPEELDIVCPTPSHGPTGPHAVVVDYNSDLDVRFAQVRLQANGTFTGMAGLTNKTILSNFNFHQVNVWAIVERTLEMLENKYLLGRAVPWAHGAGRLVLIPHAGYAENAFYDRGTGALHFFYFEGHQGETVFTCLSHDIVAHELGHAVLDGLKPGYNEVCSPETAGFHEYFGDAVAMVASLGTRETALVVAKEARETLSARNVVSAIASEFGAALRGIQDEEYLRGAWSQRKVTDLRKSGNQEEHDWSEVLTGIYYELLSYLYALNRRDIVEDDRRTVAQKSGKNVEAQHSMRALMRSATQTAGVMFRAIDYCPPVDVRYDEYARAVLRAQEVAYPLDEQGIRRFLIGAFRKRGIKIRKDEEERRGRVQRALRELNVSETAGTQADAYRFLDQHRNLFDIPYDVNLTVCAVYRTNKHTKNGYRPPREHVIEFTWNEDVELEGERFGPLDATSVPLWCGGTVVFDSNGNFLHLALVPSTPTRKKQLKVYVSYLVRTGALAMASAGNELGAPCSDNAAVVARVTQGRAGLARIAAMRHMRRRT